MTIHDAYEQLKDLVNKNSTNDNASISRPRFVRLFNTAQNTFVNWIIEKGNQKDRRLVQTLIVPRKRLLRGKEEGNLSRFTLPSDYFEFQDIETYATCDVCKKKKMTMTEVKGENLSTLLQSSTTTPSFKFREGLYQVGDDSAILYTDEEKTFKYSDVYLSYYRKPVQVDIDGYINDEGKDSTAINPEFNDRIVEIILLIAAKNFNTNSDNLSRYQIDISKLISKF